MKQTRIEGDEQNRFLCRVFLKSLPQSLPYFHLIVLETLKQINRLHRDYVGIFYSKKLINRSVKRSIECSKAMRTKNGAFLFFLL